MKWVLHILSFGTFRGFRRKRWWAGTTRSSATAAVAWASFFRRLRWAIRRTSWRRRGFRWIWSWAAPSVISSLLTILRRRAPSITSVPLIPASSLLWASSASLSHPVVVTTSPRPRSAGPFLYRLFLFVFREFLFHAFCVDSPAIYPCYLFFVNLWWVLLIFTVFLPLFRLFPFFIITFLLFTSDDLFFFSVLGFRTLFFLFGLFSVYFLRG